MRTLWVAGAVLVAAMTVAPVGAAPPPRDPNGVGLSADHTADCTGVTIVTEGWPEGSAGVLDINGVGHAIPMNSTGNWPTEGSYTFTIRFSVPGQVDSAEYENIICEAPTAIDPEPVVKVELPATM